MAKIKNTSSNILTRVLLIILTGSFLIFFFEKVQPTYNSYTNLQKEIELNKAEKSEIQNQIADWNQQISDLDDPEKLVNELVSNDQSSNALLCLDLEHKGPLTTQHINPNLPVLKKILLKNSFKEIKKFGDIGIWNKSN